MMVKEFVSLLHCCIQEEFIAVTEVIENVIHVRFIDAKLINITVTEE